MKKSSDFEVDYDFFSGEREEDMVWIRFKENLIQRATHLDAKNLLFDYLDLIAKSDEIKVLLNLPESLSRSRTNSKRRRSLFSI